MTVTVEHLYINQLVPLALSRQGRPAFHASVVTVPGGAVAFLGKTGMGKSTLAASFALGDAAFLTDDALLIEETDDGCRALPSHASLRLWEDSVDALIDDDKPQADPISYSNKARLLAGDALTYSDEPQPLLAAYVLEQRGHRDRSYPRTDRAGPLHGLGQKIRSCSISRTTTLAAAFRMDPSHFRHSADVRAGLSARLWHAAGRTRCRAPSRRQSWKLTWISTPN